MMLSSIHRIQEKEWQLEGQVQGLQVRGPLSLSLISCQRGGSGGGSPCPQAWARCDQHPEGETVCGPSPTRTNFSVSPKRVWPPWQSSPDCPCRHGGLVSDSPWDACPLSDLLATPPTRRSPGASARSSSQFPFGPTHFDLPGERPGPGPGPELSSYLGYDDRWTRGATCSQLPAAAGQLGNIASTCSSLDATDQELICMRRSVNPLEPAGMQDAGDGQRAGSESHGSFKRKLVHDEV